MIGRGLERILAVLFVVAVWAFILLGAGPARPQIPMAIVGFSAAAAGGGGVATTWTDLGAFQRTAARTVWTDQGSLYLP